MKTTFIYVLNDPRDGRIRYVGKADNPYRRWQQHISTAGTDDYRGHWISELLAAGLKPELEVLEEIPREGWQEIEKEYIRVFRMVNMKLTNCTDGGDGCLGARPSVKTRAKISVALRGKKRPPLSPEHRAKIGAANRGQIRSFKTREKMRASGKIKIFSPEHRANIRLANTNPSAETREKIGAFHRGKKFDLEHRANLSAALKGRKFSPEHCANIRAGRQNLSAEARANMSAAHRGKKLSKEHCARLSAARKGKPWSEKRRAAAAKRISE